MNILITIFFVSLLLGQLGGIPVAPGVTIYTHDIALVALGIYAAFHMPKKKLAMALATPVVVFFAATLISLLANAYRFSVGQLVASSLYALRWVAYASVYAVVLILPTSLSWWIWGLYSMGSGIAIIGLIQYFWYPYLRNLSYLGWDPHLYRVFSTLFDPNFAAILFVVTLLLGIYIWAQRRHRWLVGISMCVVLAALFLTYSRSGYLAFVAGIGVLAWCMKKGHIALAVISLFLAVLFLLPRTDGEGVKLLRTASSLARLGNWQRGMTLIGESPVFGHGFDTLRYVQQAKGWTDDVGTVSRAGAGIDNSFQFIWATTGIVGFVAYAWILFRFIRFACERRAKKSHDLLGAVSVAALAAIAVDSLFGNSLFYPWILLWFWVMAGVVERSRA